MLVLGLGRSTRSREARISLHASLLGVGRVRLPYAAFSLASRNGLSPFRAGHDVRQFLPFLELPMNGFDVAALFAAFLAAFILAAWSAFLLFGV